MKRSVQAPLLVLAGLTALWALSVRSADRDALRHIVQDECLPHWREAHDPAPCARVALPDSPQGYAVLADRKGGAHFLLIPTQTLTGIEDPLLLRAGAPNYFAAAWQARARLGAVLGQDLPRDAVGLAINSALARGQDQFHIHIECLQPPLRAALRAAAAGLSDRWAPLRLGAFSYHARRIMGAELDRSDPIAMLAAGVPGAAGSMASYTLLVAGMQFTAGPGFAVLAGSTASGTAAPAERLLDGTCALDR
ncbi:MAG TPA: CDP-diacylglycerol diphosphatase [Steroidobacteraceae bacterium]